MENGGDRMKCVEIYKENNSVYMVDSESDTIELTDYAELNKYENATRIQLLTMLNEFFERKDSENYTVLADIVAMAKDKNIDHYAYGEVGADKDTCIIDYYLKNRESYLDCKLRVFYEKESSLRFMISFASGNSGSIPGFDYYLFFDKKAYNLRIKPIIEKYFSIVNDCDGELEILDGFYTAIKNAIFYYYN